MTAASGRPARRLLPVILCALWVCFIWGNSLQPASVSGAHSGAATDLLARWLPWLTDHIVRKSAHFAEYAVLGALLAWVFYPLPGGVRPRLPLILLLGMSVPLADESIQLFVPGRSGRVQDVLLDLSGVLCALALCAAIRALVRKRRG